MWLTPAERMIKMTEIIFEVLGIVLLLIIGFWGGFKLGELTQIKKQAEKNETETEIVVILIEDGEDK